MIAGPFRLIDFVIAPGAPRAIDAGIGSDFTPVNIARFWIDTQAPRVACAHGENFGAGLGRTTFKEITFGN